MKATSLFWWFALASLVIELIFAMSGLGVFSALALTPLILIGWFLAKPEREAFGISWGKGKYYLWALIYPLVVVGLLLVCSFAFAEVGLEKWDPGKFGKIIAINTLVGTLIVALTEEGFFRGLLWYLAGEQRSRLQVLLITSGVFLLWHIPFSIWGGEGDDSVANIPIYLVNVFLLGFSWGCLRELSGTILVPAMTHAFWNALVYALFGVGADAGMLTIDPIEWFGPERGILGILLNFLVAAFFYWQVKRSEV